MKAEADFEVIALGCVLTKTHFDRLKLSFKNLITKLQKKKIHFLNLVDFFFFFEIFCKPKVWVLNFAYFI